MVDMMLLKGRELIGAQQLCIPCVYKPAQQLCMSLLSKRSLVTTTMLDGSMLHVHKKAESHN
jgi:hypothetical protein